MAEISLLPLPHSRASQYGEGVFETMRVNQAGKIVLLETHMQRLRRGLHALSLQAPDAQALQFARGSQRTSTHAHRPKLRF